MQPMNLKETMDNVFNTANLNIKKRKGYVKKVKVVDKHQVNRDTVTSSETTITTIKTEPVSVATTSSYFELETTERPNVHRGKCLYQSRKCEKERAIKRNGKPHNLCEEHRTKQNQHQRKFDAKKFLRKRQRDNVSYEDSELGRGILRLRRNDEPIVKRYRVMANQEAETKTSSAETNSQATAPMVAPMRRNYPTIYATEATPVSAGMTRLPLIPSPRRTSLETMYGAVRPGVIPDAQLRGHVGFSGYRREAGGQSLRVSHRPNLQQQDAQRLVGYTQSELAAASTLTQSQPFRLGATLSTSGSYKNELFAARPSLGAMASPRLLPSLLVPPSAAISPNPYPRVSGIVSYPAQRFASVAGVSFCSARAEGKPLPPLVSFGRQKLPSSSLPVFNHFK